LKYRGEAVNTNAVSNRLYAETRVRQISQRNEYVELVCDENRDDACDGRFDGHVGDERAEIADTMHQDPLIEGCNPIKSRRPGAPPMPCDYFGLFEFDMLPMDL
jgi:hypothetical protein